MSAGFSWLSVSRAITVENSSTWLTPILWFSLFYTALSLEFVLVKEKIWLWLTIILGLLFSLIFVQNFAHLAILLLAIGLLLISLLEIKKDLDLNVKIHLPKTLRMGKTYFVLALALAISSQYYFQAKSAGLLKIPSFNVGEILNNNYTKKFLYNINPDFQKLEDENLTIDELILDNYEKNLENDQESPFSELIKSGQDIPLANFQILEELKKQKILEVGREQFGEMAGRELAGTEKVTEVLTDVVNQKISSFASPNLSSGSFSAIPIAMTAILFLTIISLGAFILRFLVHLVGFIFWLLLSLKAIKVVKAPVEMEVIE